MAIIAKNIIIGGQVVEGKVSPPPKPVTDFENIRQTKAVVEETPQERYKHVQHGDLHRLFNTKSDYLKDMADL